MTDVLRLDMSLDVPGEGSVAGCDVVPVADWLARDPATERRPARRMVEERMPRVDRPGRGARRIEINGPPVARGSARPPEGDVR